MKKLAIDRGKTTFRMGIDKTEQLEQWLIDNPMAIGVALVGRSNVGKSSLINTLFGKSTARVSKTPGRTRQINIFSFQLEKDEESLFYLFDLPGYGHAEVSKEMAKNWNKLMSSFFRYISPNVLLLNIQDARHPHQKVDQEFHDFLKNYDKETYLIFNKLDKLKNQKEKAQLEKLKPIIFKEYKWVNQIYFVSAEKKTGIEALEDSVINFMLRGNLS
jgi:GTP-binding protein